MSIDFLYNRIEVFKETLYLFCDAFDIRFGTEGDDCRGVCRLIHTRCCLFHRTKHPGYGNIHAFQIKRIGRTLHFHKFTASVIHIDLCILSAFDAFCSIIIAVSAFLPKQILCKVRIQIDLSSGSCLTGNQHKRPGSVHISRLYTSF